MQGEMCFISLLIFMNFAALVCAYAPVPVVHSLRLLACHDSGFESHQQHRCLSVVCVVCCQVEVSAVD
jgi:hypothetical protein